MVTLLSPAPPDQKSKLDHARNQTETKKQTTMPDFHDHAVPVPTADLHAQTRSLLVGPALPWGPPIAPVYVDPFRRRG